MGLEAGITVAAVLTDEALEEGAEDDQPAWLFAAEAIGTGVACCGGALPDDASEGDDEGGGEGKREAPALVAAWYVVCSISFAFGSGAFVSSTSR